MGVYYEKASFYFWGSYSDFSGRGLGASEIWLSGEDVEIGFHGSLALILGALGSLLVGGFLMALLFFSSKYGYDEQVFSADDDKPGD